MSELEQDVLQSLLNNELLLATVKKSFKETVDSSKPDSTQVDSDEVLGQKYRAFEYARQLVVDAFTELESYRKEKEDKKKFNKSR